ncbi:MAG: glycosyltransferase family 2 protein [Bacteroidota bacterium]
MNKISILLPCFNAAKFLPACLESILNQTEQDWELIAIDDHSIDNTFEILKTYAAKYPHQIKVFQNQGKGIIPALKLAFEKSSGAFITRMDADDLMEKTKLETLKNLLLENGKGHVATGLVKYFSETQLRDGYKKYEQWLNNLSLENRNFEDIYKECVIPSPCWMCYRADVIKCGGFEHQQYPEDYDLCFRFYKNNLQVVSAKKVLHLWRDHSERTSRNDPNYANPNYFDLKLPYFLELDFDRSRPLVIWGAGKKGKVLAKKLLERRIDFHWVSNNEKKNGKNIYDKLVAHFSTIENFKNPQIIISVASPTGQVAIADYLHENSLDAYFFV